MAEDDCPPQERSGALPRRVPGSAGLTPGQVRRGYLPTGLQASDGQDTPPAAGVPAGALLPAEGTLPRRAPGASAIQTPPLADWPAAPGQAREASAGAQPASPAAMAASAASLLGARTGKPRVSAPAALTRSATTTPHAPARPASATPPAPPEAAARVATPGPAATAPSRAMPAPSTAGPQPPAVGPADQTTGRTTGPAPAPARSPSRSQARPGRARPPRVARRWQLAGLLITIAGVLAAVLAVSLTQRQSQVRRSAAAANAGGTLIAGEAAIRGQAATWVTSQVGRDVVIGCDAVMCSDLAQHGFPAGNLNILEPTAPDPYGSQLVIATDSIRSQFGSKLASTFAPTVIASFGTGASRIDVRVIAADGPAAYRSELSADLRARKTAGAALAANKRITVTGVARAQLLAGQVDIRLVTVLAFLAAQQPVQIVGFGGLARGAGPAVPLRWAYLAAANPVTRPRVGYLTSIIAFSRALRPPYAPLRVGTVRLPGSQVVVQIEFSAPSPVGPIGLLKS